MSKKKVFEIEVDKSNYQTIQNLMEKSKCGSRSELFLRALNLYSFFLDRRNEGKSIIVGEPDDKSFVEIDLSWL